MIIETESIFSSHGLTSSFQFLGNLACLSVPIEARAIWIALYVLFTELLNLSSLTEFVITDEYNTLNRLGTSSNTERSTQTEGNNSSQPANTFSMDLTPFYDILEELQANISSLRAEAVRLHLHHFIFLKNVLVYSPN